MQSHRPQECQVPRRSRWERRPGTVRKFEILGNRQTHILILLLLVNLYERAHGHGVRFLALEREVRCFRLSITSLIISFGIGLGLLSMISSSSSSLDLILLLLFICQAPV